MHIFDISFYGLHIAPTWYGLSYALGFIVCYIFMEHSVDFRTKKDLEALLLYVFCGVVFGGRIGYIVLYDLSFFLIHPIEMLKIWEGGMSFHGGLIGTIASVYIFAYRYRYIFWEIMDTLAVIVPVAIGFGRIGNWINGELPGYTPYDGIFPMMIDGASHFPSPLLEMLLEGIALFGVMFYFSRLIRDGAYNFKHGILSGIFLLGYSVARFTAERYRLPDHHIGYIFGTNWMTMGILYTVPMIVLGSWIVYTSIRSCIGKK